MKISIVRSEVLSGFYYEDTIWKNGKNTTSIVDFAASPRVDMQKYGGRNHQALVAGCVHDRITNAKNWEDAVRGAGPYFSVNLKGLTYHIISPSGSFKGPGFRILSEARCRLYELRSWRFAEVHHEQCCQPRF